MSKIKAFFSNSIVQIIAWVLLAVSTFVLIIGGVSAGDIAKIPTFIVGIVDAVALFILFIKRMLQAKDTDKK